VNDALEPVAEGVVRMALRTPTLPPATTTNTLIIGERALVVIEPATPFAGERAAFDAALLSRIAAGAEVAALVVTHHHADHTGDLARLRRLFEAPVYAHPYTAARLAAAGVCTVDRELGNGEAVEADAGRWIRALHTPGHAEGHLVLVDEASGVAHAGDLVAGEGTILIDPDDDGDMDAYLASLAAIDQQVEAGRIRALVPAHGPTQRSPSALLRRTHAHRLAREAKVAAALTLEPRPLAALLGDSYADTPTALWPLAERSLRAHLARLATHGRARVDERGWWAATRG
jgi:glyoxylase-like metal-dependent hydrolase (beta-lactamase superfamily II)